ncbi:MAG: EamA family transporter [Candidatus Saccharibacteria bacterium]|nr:EamA family transporter [Candidatus Saccharibacteria bacterium]
MWWLALPVAASVFYCFNGYIQNYLTDVALPKKRAGALAITHALSFFVSLVALVLIFGRAVFMMPLGNALGLMLAGCINIIGAVFYYKAIQKGDNIDVTIFGQVAPLMSIGLGVLLLGETINANQGLGFVMIMGATLLVIFGTSSKRERRSPNVDVALITIVYCFFSILSDIVYAYFIGDRIADYTLFAQGFFFFQLGSLVTVILCFIFFESWRKALKRTFITCKKHKFYLMAELADNATLLGGEIIYKFALIVAPVVSLLSPIARVSNLFVSFFIVLLLGRLFPKFITAKRMTKKIILYYIIAGIIITVGIILMNS